MASLPSIQQKTHTLYCLLSTAIRTLSFAMHTTNWRTKLWNCNSHPRRRRRNLVGIIPRSIPADYRHHCPTHIIQRNLAHRSSTNTLAVVPPLSLTASYSLQSFHNNSLGVPVPPSLHTRNPQAPPAYSFPPFKNSVGLATAAPTGHQ